MGEGMDEAWNRVKRSIRLANAISDSENAHSLRTDLQRSAESVVERCRVERKRARASEVPADLGDEAVDAAAKWSERLPLQDYDGLLQHVPRLVNVVTCAEAVPVPGSGVKLPLDLHHIGARCSNAYFAPRRFSAVQLAFDWPRCRVLVFRTPNAYRNPSNAHAFQTRTRLPTRANRLPAQIPAVSSEPVRFFSPCKRTHTKSLIFSGMCRRVRGPDGGATVHHARGAPAGRRSRHPFTRTQLSSGEPGLTTTFEPTRVYQQCATSSTRSHRSARPPSTRVWTATRLRVHIPRQATLIARALSVRPRRARSHSTTGQRFPRARSPHSLCTGLAWRPPRESICCGTCTRHGRAPLPRQPSANQVCVCVCLAQKSTRRVNSAVLSVVAHPFYTRTHAHTHTHSTRSHALAAGRANLPGSTRERHMLSSFARMLPELLRHSDRADILERIPQHIRDAHRPHAVERDDAPLATAEVHGDGLGLGGERLQGLWGSTGGDDAAAEALALFGAVDMDAFAGDDGLALLDNAGF